MLKAKILILLEFLDKTFAGRSNLNFIIIGECLAAQIKDSNLGPEGSLDEIVKCMANLCGIGVEDYNEEMTIFLLQSFVTKRLYSYGIDASKLPFSEGT